MKDSALSGIKIVDLTIARAGPTAVRLLSDFGAEVVRIERPGNRDGLTGRHDSPDYANLHRNTRLLALDLKQEAGREVLHRLLAQADVVVENFRPPVKRRLGIEYEVLAERYPSLIYGSISGYGQDGPAAEKGAVDQIMQGFGGIQSVTGDPDGMPMRVGLPICDLAAGHQLAIGLLVALMERGRSGKGQWVHVSLLEAAVSTMDFQIVHYSNSGVPPVRAGNNHPKNAPTGTFRTATDPINVSASSDKLWAAMVQTLGDASLGEDERFKNHEQRLTYRPELNAAIESILLTDAATVWLNRLDAVGVPCGPVHTVAQTIAHPYVQHHQMLTDVETPNGETIKLLRTPVQLSRTPGAIHRASPLPGRENRQILGELGYAEDEILRFEDAAVTEPPAL
jgi:crotonobetainyl-CoA:carnitine CoA-transferase CaiB-like acyl-CoA transferase